MPPCAAHLHRRLSSEQNLVPAQRHWLAGSSVDRPVMLDDATRNSSHLFLVPTFSTLTLIKPRPPCRVSLLTPSSIIMARTTTTTVKRPCHGLWVLFAVMLTWHATSAFQVKTALGSAVRDTHRLRHRLGTTTSLSATSLPHQKPARTTTKGGTGTAKRRPFPAQDWTALPLRRDELVKRSRELDRIELVVGRVAMVGASIFLAKELFTGESIVEQVTEIFTKVT
jgi:hypothetical protein